MLEPTEIDMESADGIRSIFHSLVDLIHADRRAGLQAVERLFTERPVNPEARHHYYAALCAAAVTAGNAGVDSIHQVVRSAVRPTPRKISLHALWAVANGAEPSFDLGGVAHPPLTSEVQASALAATADLMVEATSNKSLLEIILQSMAFMPSLSDSPESRLADFFLQIVSRSSITITEELLEEFELMLHRELPESFYQTWLTEHPAFLDPLADEMLPLAPLGLEFKTDFVLRRHDGRYVVVEIEKPQDRIFTRGGDFTAEFTHAFGQVLDFQQWVNQNVAYAQQHFPDIRSPRGVLIMGLRAPLSDRELHKLERWQFNSSTVELLTFDDLAARSRLVLRSLRRVI